MSVWVYDPTTNIIVDYGSGESLTYEVTKGHIHVRGQPEGALPVGDDPTWYRWDGSKVVKRTLAEYNPRADEKQKLQAAITGSLLLTSEQKGLFTRILALIA